MSMGMPSSAEGDETVIVDVNETATDRLIPETTTRNISEAADDSIIAGTDTRRTNPMTTIKRLKSCDANLEAHGSEQKSPVASVHEN